MDERRSAFVRNRLGSARQALFWALLALGIAAGGCASVRPEQRAILADPVMQFENEPGEEAARQHVFENREAAIGGGSVKGGGCGCN